MKSADVSYLKMREEQEKAAARRAQCPEAQRAHEELAARYAAMQMGGGNKFPLESGATFPYLWQLGARPG
jgi:hypothetical protein